MIIEGIKVTGRRSSNLRGELPNQPQLRQAPLISASSQKSYLSWKFYTAILFCVIFFRKLLKVFLEIVFQSCCAHPEPLLRSIIFLQGGAKDDYNGCKTQNQIYQSGGNNFGRQIILEANFPTRSFEKRKRKVVGKRNVQKSCSDELTGLPMNYTSVGSKVQSFALGSASSPVQLVALPILNHKLILLRPIQIPIQISRQIPRQIYTIKKTNTKSNIDN